MKRLLFVVLLLGVLSCSKTPVYNITVNLEGATGTVLLEQTLDGNMVAKDSAVLVNGSAVLSGMVDHPDMYYLSIRGERRKMILFLENSDITVTAHPDSLNLAKITGSSIHAEYKSVNSKIETVEKEYMALYQESRKLSSEGDTAKANELMSKVDEMYASTGVMMEDFIKSHPASYVTPYFLSQIQYEKDENQLESLLQNLDPILDSVSTVQTLRTRVEKMKTVSVGRTAPDFTQNDPDGNPVKFSDAYSKNQYTLVDFWAAWCGPCRQENPNVVAVYNEYKEKGFSVFGVSLDRTREDWLKAIADDKLTWQHVSDLSYWNNEAAKLYAVNSIPSNLLVDKEGKIIAKNLRGEDLKEKIAELLK